MVLDFGTCEKAGGYNRGNSNKNGARLPSNPLICSVGHEGFEP